MMTAKVLGANVNVKTLDITKGEQLKPEFLKVIILPEICLYFISKM